MFAKIILAVTLLSLAVAIAGRNQTDAKKILNAILKEKEVLHGVEYVSTLVDSFGNTHHRFTQTYRDSNIPIWEGDAIVHFYPNDRFDITDNFVNVTRIFSTTPTVPLLSAVLKALNLLIWPLFTPVPETDLVVLNARVLGAAEGYAVLAWRVHIPILTGTKYVFVNAHLLGKRDDDVEELFSFSDERHAAATGVGPAVYQGNVNFTTEFVYGTNYLQDLSRKSGVFTCLATNCTSASVITDSNGIFNDTATQKVAINIHYAATKYLDFLKNVYNRTGMDGSGGPYTWNNCVTAPGTNNIFAHKINSNPVNTAIYTPSGIIYGMGDGVTAGPVASLDIVAHEMTHALIASFATLNYYGQNAAVEESLCDIFAALLEYNLYGELNTTWMIGEDFYTPGIAGDALRYMDEPHKADNGTYNFDADPDHFSEFYNGTDDNGGAHTNAGIMNKMFYLLVKGGKHPRDPTNQNMTGIGFVDAGKIAFQVMYYLTSYTDFPNAQIAFTRAAKDIFGTSSVQWTAVQVAWALCGVGAFPAHITSQLLTNTGFESQASPWSMSGTGLSYVRNGAGAFAGRGYMKFGDSDSTVGVVEQNFTIPNGVISANLTVHLKIETTEVGGTAKDYFTVHLNTPIGLQYLYTYSNLDQVAGWITTVIDVMPYVNSTFQPIALRFTATNDGTYYTVWKLDEVRVDVAFPY